MDANAEASLPRFLRPSMILAAVLAGFGLSVFHRPYLPEFLPAYQAFDDVMPWAAWGWVALLIVPLLFARRGTPWRLAGDVGAGLFLYGVSSAFYASAGVTSAVTTYFVLASLSLILSAQTVALWASRTRWWRRLLRHPPGWLLRLARLHPVEDVKGG